ncbi:unnamed protein product [Symbiodinium sp. CCMP2456]|nr:unnamed protein product [Symbiodinium sp. CCMP2456]
MALETIGENDPRVKKLQEIAWGLQSVTNRPGNRLPEDAKRAAYRVTSRAIALCTNAEYVEVDDFVKRAAALTKEIEDKKKELQELEEAIKADLSGKCYRATGDGGIPVHPHQAQKPPKSTYQGHQLPPQLPQGLIESSWDSATWNSDLPRSVPRAPNRILHERHLKTMNKFKKDVERYPGVFADIVTKRRQTSEAQKPPKSTYQGHQLPPQLPQGLIESSWDSATWNSDLPRSVPRAPNRILHERHLKTMNKFKKDVERYPGVFADIVTKRRQTSED